MGVVTTKVHSCKQYNRKTFGRLLKLLGRSEVAENIDK